MKSYQFLDIKEILTIIVWTLLQTKTNKAKFILYCDNVLCGKSARASYNYAIKYYDK